ncbi:MAG: hypothetical protein H6835_05180 [Planctomycetes bacterium]|nr:hypothetical protein [Planctomycetota bacterium]
MLALAGLALGFAGGQVLRHLAPHPTPQPTPHPTPHPARTRPAAAPATPLPVACFALPGGGQGGEGLRCSGTATPGGTLNVEVASNDDSVAVTNPLTGETTHHGVGPSKVASVPIPPLPPGSVLHITVGWGARTRTVTVEIVAPAS